MEFDSKSYFENFLRSNLTMENAEDMYHVFYSLEAGEEILFRNCCNILGIDRAEFLKNFVGTEIFDIDEDVGLTAIAAAERFGTIEYEYPDEPSYGTVKEMTWDNDNPEYMKFRQKLYHSAVCEILNQYDEDDYHYAFVLGVVEKIGVYKENQRNAVLEKDGVNYDKSDVLPPKPSILARLQEGKKAVAQSDGSPKTAPKRDSKREV